MILRHSHHIYAPVSYTHLDVYKRQFDDYVYQTGAKTVHDHVTIDLETQNGEEFKLIYNDPRRFGLWDLVKTIEIEQSKHFAHLGPEPLEDDFKGKKLLERIGKKAAPIKPVSYTHLDVYKRQILTCTTAMARKTALLEMSRF